MIQNNLKKIKNLEIKINEPFHELSLNFLNSFSLELKKNKRVYIIEVLWGYIYIYIYI